MIARILLLLVALATAACSLAGAIPGDFERVRPKPPGDGPHIEMHYLGNGGWIFRRGNDVIATAPFVSNPRGLALLLPAASDKNRLEAKIPVMADVDIILVGHAHYDHAMDLPYIAEHKAPKAVFHGGRTLKNVLGTTIGEGRFTVVEHEAAVGDRPGRWFYNPTRSIRFMPLRSTHAPHFAGLKLVATGSVEQPRRRPPRVPLFWKEGETLAFLVDFLDGNEQVQFRIYYQDAASRPGTGIVPVLAGRDAARTDVAILMVASFAQVHGNPEHILTNVQPRHIVGGHWEDFFSPASPASPIGPVPGTSLADFYRRARAVSSASIYLPAPGERLFFPITMRR